MTPAYSAPSDASRDEKILHFLRMARTKYPRQGCPLTYLCWVVDGPTKRPNVAAKTVESIKVLMHNRRFKEALTRKNERVIYVPGKGKDAGYRLNADDDDLATVVLATDKRRAKTALHRAAQTHTMIDESKLTLPEAKVEYQEVGSMVSVLGQSGFLRLEDMSQGNIKRLQSGIAKRKGRAA